MPFSFEPLDDNPNALRLLRVHGIDREGYIQCSIRNVDLRTCRFLALSHVWGKASRTCKIVIEGIPFWVRPNLWSFLTYASERLCDLDIWIDALCIDQSNIAERNRQILSMGRIFSQATRVICWLHESNEAAYRMGKVDPNAFGPQMLAQAVRDPHLLRSQPKNAELLTSALVRFMEHEYWSRLWVVQELRLAHTAVFCWAQECLDWSSLRSFVTSILTASGSGNTMMDTLAELLMNGPWKISNLAFFDFFRRDMRSGQNNDEVDAPTHSDKSSLLELVLQFRLHLCSVPHDRVYALLSLADNAGAFVPDYSEPPVSLMARLLATASDFPEPEITECVGKLLDVNLEEWIRSKAIAARHPSETKYTAVHLNSMITFNSQLHNLHPLIQDNRESYVIACFTSMNFCFLLAYEDDSDTANDYEYFYASFKGSIRPVPSPQQSEQVETFLDVRPSYLSGCEFIYWKKDAEIALHCEDWGELHQFLQTTMTDKQTLSCIGWDFSRPSTD